MGMKDGLMHMKKEGLRLLSLCVQTSYRYDDGEAIPDLLKKGGGK